MTSRLCAGETDLPALSLDLDAFRANAEAFFRLCRAYGAEAAPHAKTPMCPEIALELVGAGALGASVANLQQAKIMLDSGIEHILVANQVGGAHAAWRLRGLLEKNSQATISVFADSVTSVAVLANALKDYRGAPLPVYAEVGSGRAGARDIEAARGVVEAIIEAPALLLAGVAAYEGAVPGASEDALEKGINDLFGLVGDTFALARARCPESRLMITAGGSVHFDRVIARLGLLAKADGNAGLLLRSGALFFSDHGIYARAFENFDKRALLSLDGETFRAGEAFRPAMRLWAEILSVPEPSLAIAGMGMRDVSFDQGLPMTEAVYRDGAPLPLNNPTDAVKAVKLNDHHAFLELGDSVLLRPGDIVEFGISHPCTCFDRWRFFHGLDGSGRIVKQFQTFFH